MVWCVTYSSLEAVDWSLYKFSGEGFINLLALVYAWSLLWQLTLSPSKCEVLNITNKHSPVSIIYTIDCLQKNTCETLS